MSFCGFLFLDFCATMIEGGWLDGVSKQTTEQRPTKSLTCHQLEDVVRELARWNTRFVLLLEDFPSMENSNSPPDRRSVRAVCGTESDCNSLV